MLSAHVNIVEHVKEINLSLQKNVPNVSNNSFIDKSYDVCWKCDCAEVFPNPQTIQKCHKGCWETSCFRQYRWRLTFALADTPGRHPGIFADDIHTAAWNKGLATRTKDYNRNNCSIESYKS